MAFVQVTRTLLVRLASQQENKMKLVIAVLLANGFGQPAQTVPVPGTKETSRHSRDVPMTSYFRDSPAGLPAAGYGAAINPTVNIVKQKEESNINGEFSYSFEADNGISVEVKGYQKSIGPDEEGQAMEGQYSYTAPDGTPLTVQWTADETGFHAKVIKNSIKIGLK